MVERLKNLEENVADLKKLKAKITPEDVRNNRFDEWALRYGLFESIQIVIDIACHIVGKQNLGVTESYADCIEKLARYGYIDKVLAKKLVASIGLRNLLIHEYSKIDSERLYGYLDNVDDFSDFVIEIRNSMNI